MEYVTGFAALKGGLQRFKLGLHGASLEVAAMVAYVQDNDPDGWLVRINGWISSLNGTDCSEGCHWSETEQIGDYRLTKKAHIASGKSTHPRTAASSPDIDIHHFWVSVRRKRTRAKKSGNDTRLTASLRAVPRIHAIMTKTNGSDHPLAACCSERYASVSSAIQFCGSQ